MLNHLINHMIFYFQNLCKTVLIIYQQTNTLQLYIELKEDLMISLTNTQIDNQDQAKNISRDPFNTESQNNIS